jgi:molecular chaperone DnaK
MRKDAELHASDDKQKRELIDARNQADQLVYQIEKMLKENADKISDDDKKPIQAGVEKVKQVASKDDTAAIRQAMDELQQASHAMAQHLYSKGQPEGPSAAENRAAGDGQSAGKEPGKEDVIDAEFEVKK